MKGVEKEEGKLGRGLIATVSVVFGLEWGGTVLRVFGVCWCDPLHSLRCIECRECSSCGCLCVLICGQRMWACEI